MNISLLKNYWQLMRLHQPIGFALLLWPTLWALWIAADGKPHLFILVIFIIGTLFMRSAGCIINDIADQHWDKNVSRTKNRPLAAGRLTTHQALWLFVVLLTISFFLVCLLNRMTIILAFFAALFAIAYPFTKRFTYWPQLFLGIAFASSIPMAFAAEMNHLPSIVWILFLTTLLWTLAYDTQYAMVDRQEDIPLGIRSTAILFGNQDVKIIAFLQIAVVALLITIGLMIHAGWLYFAFLASATLFFIYQHFLIRSREPQPCFKAFLNNHWVGMVIFLGLFFNYLLK